MPPSPNSVLFGRRNEQLREGSPLGKHKQAANLFPVDEVANGSSSGVGLETA